MNIQTKTRTAPLTPDYAEQLLSELFGLSGKAERLPSEVDDTFRIAGHDGKRYTLKVAAVNERADVLAFQTGAMLHLENACPVLPVPRILRTRSGETMLAVNADGQSRLVRLLSWLDGTPMHAAEGSTAQMRALGIALGTLDRGLENYRPPVPSFELLWDITHIDRVAGWTANIAEPALRELTGWAFRQAAVAPSVEANLPRQVIHNDINPHNIIVETQSPDRIAGIIDFGDLIEAPRINDLAIALSYQLGREDGLQRSAALIGGYRSVVRLMDAECDALLPKVLARLAMTVAITTSRAADNPGHAAYILRNRPVSVAGLERLSSTIPEAWANLLEGQML